KEAREAGGHVLEVDRRRIRGVRVEEADRRPGFHTDHSSVDRKSLRFFVTEPERRVTASLEFVVTSLLPWCLTSSDVNTNSLSPVTRHCGSQCRNPGRFGVTSRYFLPAQGTE